MLGVEEVWCLPREWDPGQCSRLEACWKEAAPVVARVPYRKGPERGVKARPSPFPWKGDARDRRACVNLSMTRVVSGPMPLCREDREAWSECRCCFWE